MKKKYIKPETCIISVSTEGGFMREYSWAVVKDVKFGENQAGKIVDQTYEDEVYPNWEIAAKHHSLWDEDENE